MTAVIDERESERLALQNQINKIKTQAERNKLGQFATPAELADQILRFVRTLVPSERLVRFLDPALGTGSFYSALRREFPSDVVDTATGFEIDEVVAAAAKELWRNTPLHVRHAD